MGTVISTCRTMTQTRHSREPYGQWQRQLPPGLAPQRLDQRSVKPVRQLGQAVVSGMHPKDEGPSTSTTKWVPSRQATPVQLPAQKEELQPSTNDAAYEEGQPRCTDHTFKIQASVAPSCIEQKDATFSRITMVGR